MTEQTMLLTAHNAIFSLNGDFPALLIREKINAHLQLEKRFPRVYLRRAFPAEEAYKYISVAGKDGKEVGMIPDISIFPDAQRKLLKAELDHRYFMPKILRIDKVTDRFGQTILETLTDIGPITVAVRDIYRNLFRLSSGSVIITDADGNRYEIPNPGALDKKSYKRIELYI